jgi:hypothetical protein
MWHGLTLPNFTGANLHGFLDNSVLAPAKTFTEGLGDAAKTIPNHEYARWWRKDRTVLAASLDLSSMDEDIAC